MNKSYPFNLIQEIYGGVNEDDMEQYITAYQDPKSDVKATLGYYLNMLDERHAEMVRLRYEEKKTLSNIAETFGITQERVRQIIIHTLSGIRRRVPYKVIAKGFSAYYADTAKTAKELNFALGRNFAVSEFREMLNKENISLDELRVAFDLIDNDENNPFAVMTLEEFADAFDLSVRTYNCLKRCPKATSSKRLENISDLLMLTEEQVRNVKNLGTRSFNELMCALKRAGLTLKSSEK